MKIFFLLISFFSLMNAHTKILVTGGAGYIASHICESLLDNDYTVVIIDNFNTSYDPQLK